ncbi:hypothetical protein BDZ89DRAFT_1079012 [Hymenopellis radicata]|nr:hypothetical protein BDZ89DRAFT_1079012 [Hymenopellis radicata]
MREYGPDRGVRHRWEAAVVVSSRACRGGRLVVRVTSARWWTCPSDGCFVIAVVVSCCHNRRHHCRFLSSSWVWVVPSITPMRQLEVAHPRHSCSQMYGREWLQ